MQFHIGYIVFLYHSPYLRSRNKVCRSFN